MMKHIIVLLNLILPG